MEWTAPAFEEVCLNCEINSYASAKLQLCPPLLTR
ncbi:MAG: pyrroloquinoline quinone precursor peptide PqqA [Candidatus Sulfotelmatobacter sp.]